MFPEYSWTIHAYGKRPLGVARQDVEDDISDTLDGFAEVTGGGAGIAGWNIDVEVCDGEQLEHCYDEICAALLKVGADPHSSVHIIRTEKRTLVRNR